MTASMEYPFNVQNMTGGHFLSAVKGPAGYVVGVEKVGVNLKSGLVLNGEKGLDPQSVVPAIRPAIYSADSEQHGRAKEGNGPTPESAAVHISKREGIDADLIVVGGGSAGFAAAIRGHELGAKVILVNVGVIGGTCVNVGCVPSKTLLRAAEAHHQATFWRFAGIESESHVHDFAAIIRQKDELVASLRQAKYIDVLAAYGNVRLVEGHAWIVSPDTIRVDGRELRAPGIIITTGSRPWIPSLPGLHDVDPLTSTSVFELNRLPESIMVLGGRYIALECAQMFARLGAKVTILQRSDHLLPDEDGDMIDALTNYLQKEGIIIETSVSVTRVARENGRISVLAMVRGKEKIFTAEQILCATGRRPNTEGMGLEEAGIRLAKDGRIVVDDHLQTSVTGVYAAGDVIGEPAFVYTAAYEGNLAAENAFGLSTARTRDYNALPWVIFTDPQIAGVGMNEKEAVRAGIEIDVAKLDLHYVPRALAARDTRGFIKLIKERSGDRLLGARVLAQEGGEQIMEAAMAIRHGIGVSEIAAMFHPYLTQAEGVKLCAQAFVKDVEKLSCCSE